MEKCEGEVDKVINFKLQEDKIILPTFYCQRNEVLFVPLQTEDGFASEYQE